MEPYKVANQKRNQISPDRFCSTSSLNKASLNKASLNKASLDKASMDRR